MSEWSLILGMALVTVSTRYPVLALFGRVQPGGIVRQALHYIPAAVLSAIIVPAVLSPGGAALDLALGNARILASLVALLVAWRTRNLLLTIVTGMLALWGWQWLWSMSGS